MRTTPHVPQPNTCARKSLCPAPVHAHMIPVHVLHPFWYEFDDVTQEGHGKWLIMNIPLWWEIFQIRQTA